MNSALSLKRATRVALCSLVAAAGITCTLCAHASLVVHQAVSAVVNTGGTGAGCGIICTYDQSGLSSSYVSDVTPWAPYTATTHSTLNSTEWFAAPQPVLPTGAVVTYNLGVVTTVFGMALWNEDWGGISRVDISFGDANQVFTPWSTPMFPTNNPLGSTPYHADLIAFFGSPNTTQYVRLKMSGCPQIVSPPISFYDGCSLGEVAFAVEAVPEPGSLALVGLGCFGLVVLRRRDRALRPVGTAASSSLATFSACRSPTFAATPAPAARGPHTRQSSRPCGG